MSSYITFSFVAPHYTADFVTPCYAAANFAKAPFISDT